MIELKKICKSYGKESILKDVNIEIQEGEIVFIMGASGKGKTTLLRVMMGLEKPDSGELKGIDTSQISAVFQEDRLCMGIPAHKNITIACGGVSKSEATIHLQQVGLSQEDMAKPVEQFSGGMRRRVALVRCVMAESSYMIMDEPFQGLDVQSKEVCMDYLLRNRKGRTTIVVSHDITEAEYMRGTCIHMDSTP